MTELAEYDAGSQKIIRSMAKAKCPGCGHGSDDDESEEEDDDEMEDGDMPMEGEQKPSMEKMEGKPLAEEVPPKAKPEGMPTAAGEKPVPNPMAKPAPEMNGEQKQPMDKGAPDQAAMLENAKKQEPGEPEQTAPGQEQQVPPIDASAMNDPALNQETVAGDVKPGAAFLKGVYSELAAIGAKLVAADKATEDPKIQEFARVATLMLDDLKAAFNGSYSANYPDYPGLEVEPEAADAEMMKSMIDVEAVKLLLAMKPGYNHVLEGLADRLERVQSNPVALAKAASSVSAHMKRLSDMAKSYKKAVDESGEVEELKKSVALLKMENEVLKADYAKALALVERVAEKLGSSPA